MNAEKKYIAWLNEAISPSHDSEEWIIGGQNRVVKWYGKYGEALRRFDPIGYRVGFNDWKRGHK